MRTTLIALSALALVAGAPAAAKDFVVVHEDLDLSTPKGQKALDRRIAKAAREYCGVGRNIVGSRITSDTASTCFSETRTAAREQMALLVAKAQKGG